MLNVVRLATWEDSKDIWLWRNDTHTRSKARSSDLVEWDSHSKWFEVTLQRDDRILLIGVDELKEKVGMVRFDLTGEKTAEISVNLNPQKRGLGLAKPLLTEGIEYAKKKGVRAFIAEIKNENVSSVRTFKSIGFSFVDSNNELSFFRMTADEL